jgi:hypothetical protein
MSSHQSSPSPFSSTSESSLRLSFPVLLQLAHTGAGGLADWFLIISKYSPAHLSPHSMAFTSDQPLIFPQKPDEHELKIQTSNKYVPTPTSSSFQQTTTFQNTI